MTYLELQEQLDEMRHVNERLEAENEKLRLDVGVLKDRDAWISKMLERRDETIAAVAERSLKHKRNAESFERRWREAAAEHSVERARRQRTQAGIEALVEEYKRAGVNGVLCSDVAEHLEKLFASDLTPTQGTST